MPSSDRRPVPPSKGRLGAAARAGLFVRTPLISLGAALLGGALVLHAGSAGVLDEMVDLMRQGLTSTKTPITAVAAMRDTLLPRLLLLFGILLPICVAAVLLPALLPMRRGATAVALPRAVSSHRDLPAVSLLCLLIGLPVTMAILASAGFAYEEWATAPLSAANRVLSMVTRILAAWGVIALSGGIAHLSLYKIRLLRELSLSHADAQRESRLHAGSGTFFSHHRS